MIVTPVDAPVKLPICTTFEISVNASLNLGWLITTSRIALLTNSALLLYFLVAPPYHLDV